VNKKWLSVVLMIVGALLLVGGLYLILIPASAEGFLSALPFILIGVGCGALGQGIGDRLQQRKIARSPALAKQQANERNDERNIAIANRAKAKAFDLMVYVFGALLLSFAQFGVSTAATISLTAAYLLVIGYRIFVSVQFDREM